MKKGKGLLALLGIGVGALAFWQYKKMSPQKKEELKSKVNDAGRKIRDKVYEGGSRMEDAKNDVTNKVKQEAQNLNR